MHRRAPARFVPLIVSGITFLGAALRMFLIGTKGLWIDEAFSVWLGRQPLGQMWGWLLRIDQHPPLYYTLLHFWMYLGDSANMVRLLAALLGTLTIPVIYCLGRRLMGTRAGLLAALILAISPFHVRLGQETRMYTLLTLNASLALLALVYLLTDPCSAAAPIGSQLAASYRARRAFRRGAAAATAGAYECRPSPGEMRTDLAWLAYMVFTAATLLSHNTAILFLLATNLFVCGFIFWPRLSRCLPGQNTRNDNLRPSSPDAAPLIRAWPAALLPPSLRNWLIAQLGVVLLWSPWLPGFLTQARGVYAQFWLPQPTLATVVGTLGVFLSDLLPVQPIWINVTWAGLALLVGLGFVALRSHSALRALLLTLIVTPFAGEWLVSLKRPIFYDRTLIWASLPLYLLLAAGLCRLRNRSYRLAGVALLVTVSGLSLNQYYFHFEKEQWQEAAAYVGQAAQAGDLLLFNTTWGQIPFDYYYRVDSGSHSPVRNLPLPEHGAPADLFDRGILEPKMIRADLPRLHDLIQGHERVWLIYSHEWYTDPEHLIPDALGHELSLLDRRQFNGLQALLYGILSTGVGAH